MTLVMDTSSKALFGALQVQTATTAGREGDIFRKVIGWSAVLLAIMCVLVTLQGSAVLGWMIR